MEPIIIRVKPDARVFGVIALAGVGATLLILFKNPVGLVAGVLCAIAAAVLIYLIGRRAVLAYDAAVIVRDYFSSTKYRWSRVAGFGSLDTDSGTIGVMNLLNGDEVPLPMWTEPEADTLQRLNNEARRRQNG